MESQMKINSITVKIKDLVEGYDERGENGVYGFGGKLNIRPAYQREFVYNEKQQVAVINSVMKGYPLNSIYWVKNDDGTYEVLDGQQRIISICRFFNNQFRYGERNFKAHFPFEQAIFLNYEIPIFVCEGNERERLELFKTVNTPGVVLTDQELLNINYTGAWLSDAKSKFSKVGCQNSKISSKYVRADVVRQELLETALDWISDGDITTYMGEHQHDYTAIALNNYFNSVIGWVGNIFTHYRKEMQSVNWGKLYNKYKDIDYNPVALEEQVKVLMANDEVTDKKGIYEYVLSGGDEMLARKLSKRTFSERDKRTAYEQQGGICPICGGHFEYEEMAGDHITPWWRGGTTTLNNLQMVCKKCNGQKSGKTMAGVEGNSIS